MDEGLLNDLLECSVCLDRLDTSSRVLPCQHTFCLKCLKEIVQSHKELRCPECRILVEAKVEELPPNVLLMRILEGMRYPRRATHSTPAVADLPITSISSVPLVPTTNHATPTFAPEPSRRISQIQQQQHPPHVAVNLFRDFHNLQLLNPQQSRVYTDQLGKSIVNVPHARANFDFISKEPGDLSFKKGDIIYLRKKIDPYWYHGESGGKTGVFPINYAQVMVGLPSQSAQCKALYDFRMSAPDEEGCLAFDKGTIIKVIRRVDENWAEGRIDNRIGIFPIAFVEMNAPAKALIKMSHNTAGSSRVAPPTPTSSGDPAARCSPRAILDTSQAPYHYQPMSLSSPLPSCVSGVASSMSQSHPVYQHQLSTQTKSTAAAELVHNPANNFKHPTMTPSVQSANVVPAEHYDSARLRNCKTSGVYPNQSRQDTLNSNVATFTNISSDSSSSVTTPSHCISSVTTTPNTSSDTSSSESVGRSSPSSPENSRTEGNTSSVPSQYVPPSNNEPLTQNLIQMTDNNIQNETIPNGSIPLEPSSSSPNVSFKQSDSLNTSSPKNLNSSSSMNNSNNGSGGSSKLDLSGVSTFDISVPGQSASKVSVQRDTDLSRRKENCQVSANSDNVKDSVAIVSNIVSSTHSKNVSSDQWSVGANIARGANTHRDKEKRHSLTPGTHSHTQNVLSPQNRHSAEIIATSLLDHQPHNALRPSEQATREKYRTDRDRERARERRRRRSGSGERERQNAGCGTAYVPYIALYPYRPQKADELELKKGGIYVVTERCQDGWFKGRPAGCSMRPGVFPGNYVTPATVKSSTPREQAQRHLTIEPVNSCTSKTHQRGDKDRRGSGGSNHNHTVMVSHTPHLPPRAISPTALATTTPCFIWTSPQGTAKILEKPSKDKQAQRQDKSLAGVSLMKRLAAIKKCKSPPPAVASPPAAYSMDNPVFEDCPPTVSTHQPAHVRSGSCPSQLLQVLPSQPIAGAVEGDRGVLGGSVSSAVGQRVFGARGRGSKERPSVFTGGGIRTTASGAWIEQTASHSHTTHHRKSQSLDAGEVLATRRKESSTHAHTHTQTVKERFRCVVPYPANSSYELELQVDDVVLVHKKRGDGWYKGTLAKTGRTGLFPASFVQPISDAVPSVT